MHIKNNEITLDKMDEGVTRKILSYSDKLMVVELNFEKGAEGSKHKHPHEQITYVISGKVAYKEEGKSDSIMTTGDSYYVTPNSIHGMVALEDSKVIDVFTPAREDFLKK